MVQTLEYKLGKDWEAGRAETESDDLNPSDTREVLARYRLLTAEQVRRAMAAAAAGAQVWRATSPIDRGIVMSRAAQSLRTTKAEIGAVVSRENGKTIGEATVEVEKSADFLDFYAGLARTPLGTIVADARRGTRTMTLTEPVGVVLAITPWNDPMLTPARKLAPALVAGNAVILKAARDTPLAAYHLTRALCDAGLPDGVLGLVIADHATLDDVLLTDPRLAAVSFTGSTDVGLALQRKLAGRNVRVQTEMGGKNAAVVLADADLDMAVATIAAGAFGQAGQRCTATSRIIVEAPVYDDVVKRLAAAAGALRLGASTDPTTQMGPLVNAAHRAEVLGHVDRATQAGARLVMGGSAPTAESLRHGCFVEATVMADVTSDMPIWRDEVFGPVIAVHRVGSFDEALAAVNDSSYGLSSSIFTTSLRFAQRFVDAADTGQVAVNLPTSGWDVHQPFGGFKHSGSAFKEQGLEGLRFYTRVKTAAIRFDW
jgi:aldehyde dehydrogenase (NAD+)